MHASEALRLWPNPGSSVPLATELREHCATLAANCRALAEVHDGVLFTRPPGEVAAALDEVADLRAMALHWDGYHAVEADRDRSSATLRDLRLLAAYAAETVDDLLQVIERNWLALPDAAARQLLAEPAIRPYQHYLTSVRTLTPYTLGVEGETAFAAREYAANTAWVELRNHVIGALQPVVDGEPLSIERAKSELELGGRARRESCLEAIYDALEPVASVLSHCLDSLIADRLSVNEQRGLPHARAERDLTNELPSAAVDNMLAVVEEHYDLPQRWFARKAQLLGMERLGYAHMRAPISASSDIPYPIAIETVAKAFDGLDPEAGSMVRELAAGGHVDPEPRAGKQIGASCRSLGPGRPPQILLSYFGTAEDVVSLGHEMGHALQFTLAGREHNGLSFDAPLALNEIAPAFTELLVQDRLIDDAADPAARRLLAAKRVETAIDALFMSTFLTRFETRAHQLRAEGNALTDARIQALWVECGKQFYGLHVELPKRWGLHWTLVRHLTHERFYSYTYAFARLLGLDLYARFQRDPIGFGPRFLDFLGRGGTAGPTEQLADLGVDLTTPDTWRSGLAQFAALLEPLMSD
jgi:oligoendopeptidase F